MAEKISVEIGLEGGDEVNRQLEGIQQQGEKTFGGIQKAVDQLDFSSLSDGFQQVGSTGQEAFDKIKTAAQNVAVFEQVVQGVKQVEGAFEALGTAVTRMATRMTKSLGVFGVLARSFGPLGIALGVAAGAFIKFGDSSADALGKLTTQAAKLGLTAQQLDQLQKAFGKVGISADAVSGDLEKVKGLLGGGLMRLGDIAPPEVTAGLVQFIGQLERMPDGVARTQLAMQTLGETLGGQVIAGLQTGAISAQTLAAALASVTPATQAQIVQAAQYQQALNGLSNAWTQFKAEVAAPIVTPALEWLTSQIPGIAAGIATTVREFQALWSVINTVASAGAQVIGFLASPLIALTAEVQRLASTFAGWDWNPITAGIKVWNDLIAAVQKYYDLALKALGLRSSGATPAEGGTPGMASGGLLGGRGTGTSDSNLAWVSRGEYVMPAGAVRQPGVLSFLEALRRSGRIPGFAAGGQVGDIPVAKIRGIQQPLIQAFDALDAANRSNLATMWNISQSILSAGRSMDQSLVGIQSTMRPVLQALEELLRTPGRRGGGLLGGRGTGTSDSNLAWVSRGEHIMPAAAVRQPGVLAFLELLRRSGGDLSRVLNGMGRFALGGMVPAGGLAGGGNHVTIQFPGLPAIGGLRASSSVVDQLQKAAALAQVRSGGRKPSRYS